MIVGTSTIGVGVGSIEDDAFVFLPLHGTEPTAPAANTEAPAFGLWNIDFCHRRAAMKSCVRSACADCAVPSIALPVASFTISLVDSFD